MCDQGLQFQAGNKQEQMEPRAQSPCFHANVWDNKSQGGGGVGGRGGAGGEHRQKQGGGGCKRKMPCQQN